jgi:hypothetical protein
MHSIKDKAVVVDGQIVVRPIMVVALTYDHRILDGREGVTFLGGCLLCSSPFLSPTFPAFRSFMLQAGSFYPAFAFRPLYPT